MANVIHTPGLVSVDDHSDNSSTFTIEPLHSGYGMTLGNSLRRVLLSSIAGAAVRGQLNRYAVTRYNSDVVLPHFTGNMSYNLMSVFKLNPKLRPRQSLGDGPGEFYYFFTRGHKYNNNLVYQQTERM